MIKIYSMDTCVDCSYLKDQIAGNDQFEVIDIAQHVKNLKAFLQLRDHLPVFDAVRKNGNVGIPCFVREDGSVTLSPEEVGLRSRPQQDGPACSIDGKGC